MLENAKAGEHKHEVINNHYLSSTTKIITLFMQCATSTTGRNKLSVCSLWVNTQENIMSAKNPKNNVSQLENNRKQFFIFIEKNKFGT